MKIKNGFVLREVCGEQVIMGEELGAIDFGRLLCLNETAAYLWKQAEELGDFTIGQLTDKLCEVYDASPAEALHDVSEIVEEWQQAGVLS